MGLVVHPMTTLPSELALMKSPSARFPSEEDGICPPSIETIRFSADTPSLSLASNSMRWGGRPSNAFAVRYPPDAMTSVGDSKPPSLSTAGLWFSRSTRSMNSPKRRSAGNVRNDGSDADTTSNRPKLLQSETCPGQSRRRTATKTGVVPLLIWYRAQSALLRPCRSHSSVVQVGSHWAMLKKTHPPGLVSPQTRTRLPSFSVSRCVGNLRLNPHAKPRPTHRLPSKVMSSPSVSRTDSLYVTRKPSMRIKFSKSVWPKPAVSINVVGHAAPRSSFLKV